MSSSLFQVALTSPILSEGELKSLQATESLQPTTLPTFFDISNGIEGALQRGLDELCEAADNAVRAGSQLLILSDRTDDLVNFLSISNFEHKCQQYQD
jgi:glutamate synthase (ferredoxin)